MDTLVEQRNRKTNPETDPHTYKCVTEKAPRIGKGDSWLPSQ